MPRPFVPPDTSSPNDRILSALHHRLRTITLADLSTALSDRFGGKWSAWHRFLIRYQTGEIVALTRSKEDQLGTFLGVPARPAQLTPIRQRLYIVRYLGPDGVLKFTVYSRPGAALARVRRAQSDGTFVELVSGVATWTPMTMTALSKRVSPKRGGSRITRRQKVESVLCKNGRHVLAEVGTRKNYGCRGCYDEYRARQRPKPDDRKLGRMRRANGELTLTGLTVPQKTVYRAVREFGGWVDWRKGIELLGRDLAAPNAGSGISETLNSLVGQHLLEVKIVAKVKWYRAKDIPGQEE